MTLEEKIEAQKKMNELAEGYKYTVYLQRKALKKNTDLLNNNPENRAEIMNKIQLSRTVIKECLDIYKYLTNYYHLQPSNKKNKTKPIYNMQAQAVVKLYRSGNFDINDT
ncbi:MAG: hypothetical protein Q4D26_11465 [Clostridia bacterium]|nr:hypothetical protein [Clostridia bacterium]